MTYVEVAEAIVGFIALTCLILVGTVVLGEYVRKKNLHKRRN